MKNDVIFFSKFVLLLLLLLSCPFFFSFLPPSLLLQVNAAKASVNYVPKGSSALLFQSGVDQIIQLDEYTFDDTVLEPNRTNAFVVNFYGDWCGHCRAFAPHCRQLASLIRSWSDVVKIAAINCADTYNEKICKANGVTYFPMIKYFARNSTRHGDAILMDTKPSVHSLRELLAAEVLAEYRHTSYADWPNLHPLTMNDGPEAIWQQTVANFLLIIFEATPPESSSTVGVQTALDLWSHRKQIAVRRALGGQNSMLANKLAIRTFPHAALFQRGEKNTNNNSTSGAEPVLMEQFQWNSTLNKVLERIGLGAGAAGAFFDETDNDQEEMPPTAANNNAIARDDVRSSRPEMMNSSSTTEASKSKKDNIVDCELFPARCKALYFVSETDLLKSMRMALLDEITLVDDQLQGERLQRLYAFVRLLHEHFPTRTYNASEIRRIRSNSKRRQVPTFTAGGGRRLERSERAKQVFAHMKVLLEKKAAERNESISGGNNSSGNGTSFTIGTREWRMQFENVERIYGFPFAQNASWEHCAGTSAEHRGYTCALWNAFHALTVNAYIDALQHGTALKPLAPLRAIQGWVLEFFGCDYCRRHFTKMTGEKFPMSEQRVQRLHDMPMYLWRAHNIVNKRLRGHITEDPQFLKYQFPPPFLCPTCHAGGMFSRRQTLSFLLRHYSAIRSTAQHGTDGGGQRTHNNLERAK